MISFALLLSVTAVLMPSQAQAQQQQVVNNVDIVLPEFPVNRFVAWSNLDNTTKNYAVKNLFYTEETWNNLLTSSVERMTYSQVKTVLESDDNDNDNDEYTTQWAETFDALDHIAIDDKTWDCWINHYTSNSWENLRDYHNVSWAFELIGWTETTWRSSNRRDWPESELKFYAQLSQEERLGVDRICCPPEIWNGLSIANWEFDDDGISDVQRREEMPRTNYPTASPIPIIVASDNTVVNKGFTTGAPTFTISPTEPPTKYVRRTDSPTTEPTMIPSSRPSVTPSLRPSVTPSDLPSMEPSITPTASPTKAPTDSPSTSPSDSPTTSPSTSPPTASPSASPSTSPTSKPSSSPTQSPSSSPSSSFYPSLAPSYGPTRSSKPSLSPSISPTASPSVTPSDLPSLKPSVYPSISPSASPTVFVCKVNFTLVLLTDKYSVETSWSLTSLVQNPQEIIGEGSGYKNDFEEHVELVCLSYNDCYTFEIRDKWDDGICCDNGPGSYTGFLQYADPESIDTMQSRQGASNFVTSGEDELVPIPGLNGGEFTDNEQHRFCLDENGMLAEVLGQKLVGRAFTDTKNNGRVFANNKNTGE